MVKQWSLTAISLLEYRIPKIAGLGCEILTEPVMDLRPLRQAL